MSTYFRIQSTDRPDILQPENQTSYSWNDLGDDDRARHGVSVCDSREELAEYLAQVGIPFEPTWELLEVEGHDSDDKDEDAHLGARLIHPTKIISRELVGDGFDLEIFAAYDQLAAA